MKQNKGFTLIEVMLCAAILVGLFVGLISIYIYSFDLQETARNTSLALNEGRAKLEEIKTVSLSNFSGIVSIYDGKTYNLTSIPIGQMRTEATLVNGSNGNLIDLRIVACWRQKGGRIIGEATINNATGAFTLTDLDSDGKIDSPVELLTAISNKQ